MKLSAIMVRAQGSLDLLQPLEREIFSRVLFTWIRGLNAEHDKRWRRWLSVLTRPNPQLAFYPVDSRGGPFHRRYMAIEDRLFEQQDHFYVRKGMREWLKVGAAFGHFEATCGVLVFVPSSLSPEECSDDEMREYYGDMVTFLHTPAALATLFPQVKEADRIAMLDAVFQDPTKD